MSDKRSAAPTSDQTDILELLQRRETFQEWLNRLEQQKDRVSDRVLQKVRDDYEERLRETLESLAGRRQSVHAECERATEQLENAQRQRGEALEQLEEARLRHAIGEIDEATWSGHEGQLDEAAKAAVDREAAMQSETERLRDLLDQLEMCLDKGGDASALGEVPMHVEPSRRGSAEELAHVRMQEGVDDLVEHGSDVAAEPVDAVTPEEELDTIESYGTLLSDIDPGPGEATPNASAGERGAQPAPAENTANGTEPEEDTAPKPGLKCVECGYTNDLSAWFCGVCGADVG